MTGIIIIVIIIIIIIARIIIIIVVVVLVLFVYVSPLKCPARPGLRRRGCVVMILIMTAGETGGAK